MFKRVSIRVPVLLAILVLVAAPTLPVEAATAACFTATGQCTAEPFNSYWVSNGGLPVFGYPLAAAAPEVNHDAVQPYLVQWFERERVELHPEKAAPYGILLGRLGAQRLQSEGRDWRTFPQASPTAPHYFAVTGHAIDPIFWSYWRGHGLELGDPGISEREALALFGYPLSESMVETNASGFTVRTQWFERARFEFYPNNPVPYKVELGLLGAELHPAGIPNAIPRYESRLGMTEALVTYYNAINRREYQRAYNYWETVGTSATSTPPDYTDFVNGYATTAYVAVTVGYAVGNPGAGNVYADVPVAIVATQTDGSVRVYGGCYVLHHTNPGIDPRPDAALWKLQNATITPQAAGVTPADVISNDNCPR